MRIAAADTAALMMLGLRTDPGPGWWRIGSTTPSRTAPRCTRPPAWFSVQLDVTAAEALARMRAHAFVHDRLLIDVARDVVTRQLMFTEDWSSDGVARGGTCDGPVTEASGRS